MVIANIPWCAEMRHHETMSLRFTIDLESKEMQDAIKPDKNKWLPMWMSKVADRSLRKLLKHLRVKQNVDMLPVHAGAMHDTTIMALTTMQIKRKKHMESDMPGARCTNSSVGKLIRCGAAVRIGRLSGNPGAPC